MLPPPLVGVQAAEPAAAPEVQVTAGRLRGSRQDDGTALFLGIPYAAPPVGERRWRPPAPPAHWSGVRDATAFGPACPQPASAGNAGEQDEDCLTLSVATPALEESARLPVLVEIHGGAFFAGSGRETFRDDVPPIVPRGVVLVAPNYRIGRLGFFAHPALRAEGAGAVANYWLMDQLMALEWVRDNIARFGGDPQNVTILGCSAGGSSVNSLLASARARGLFHRASVHSGGGFFNATRPLDRAEREGLAFAERVGVTGVNAEALARLRALTPEQVLAGDPGPPDFGAMEDGTLLDGSVSVVLARGTTARVPVLIGSTSNEASIFGLMGFDRAVLARRFGIDLDAVRPAYEAQGRLDAAELLRQVQTDFIFTSAALGTTALAARNGLPAYAYHFDYVSGPDAPTARGAAHCTDMPFLLGGAPDESARDREVARELTGYLYNFMLRGDPNGPGLPHWPRAAADRLEPLVIGATTRPVAGFRSRQLQPWFAKWRADTGQTLDLH